MATPQGHGMIACMAFVFFGVASTLCITASEVNKRLPFNTTSANLLTEIMKFLVATAWWFRDEGHILLKNKGDITATSSRITKKGFLLYAIPGLMYAVQNQLLYYAVFHLQPAMFQLSSKLKFVSTAVLHRLVLKRPLTSLQWLGIMTLMLGMMVSKGSLLSSACKDNPISGVPEEKGGKSFTTGLFIVVATSTISGCSGIANEYLLKKVDENSHFMLKNMQLYLWGIIFNFVGSLLETRGGTEENEGFFKGFSFWVCLVILLKSAEGVSISFIMKYLDNIVKCFASAILVYVTTFCSHILFEEPVDFFFILGLAVVTVALILYFGPHNEILKNHDIDVSAGGAGKLANLVNSRWKMLGAFSIVLLVLVGTRETTQRWLTVLGIPSVHMNSSVLI